MIDNGAYWLNSVVRVEDYVGDCDGLIVFKMKDYLRLSTCIGRDDLSEAVCWAGEFVCGDHVLVVSQAIPSSCWDNQGGVYRVCDDGIIRFKCKTGFNNPISAVVDGVWIAKFEAFPIARNRFLVRDGLLEGMYCPGLEPALTERDKEDCEDDAIPVVIVAGDREAVELKTIDDKQITVCLDAISYMYSRNDKITTVETESLIHDVYANYDELVKVWKSA